MSIYIVERGKVYIDLIHGWVYIFWEFDIYQVVFYFVEYCQGRDFSAFLKCWKFEF